MNNDYIVLKWGTLKAWDLEHNPECVELIEKYRKDGVCLSVALQKDTNNQQNILCEIVKKIDGSISNGWDNKELTKDEAIDYIRSYGKENNNE